MLMENKPAVFFDRDGVLNKDIGYLHKIEDFSWLDGAVEAIKYCNDHGYWAFVVTNQSGIARGYYTEADVQLLHKEVNALLRAKGAHVDAFFYCPHHPQGIIELYRKKCSCRKPGTEMIRQAAQSYPIDMKHSLLIGDKESDMQCAEKAGLLGVRFNGGNLKDIFDCPELKIHLGENNDSTF